MGGILYKNLESLDVMTQLKDGSYDFIYLDVPYYTGITDFCFASGEKSIRHHISKTKNIPIGMVKIEEVEEVRRSLEQEDLKKYLRYISNVIENTHRLLTEEGVVAFFSPSNEYAGINYRLVLDQFFPSYSVITIETRSVGNTSKNNYNLFFYSKKKDFSLPTLKELRPIEEFSDKDDFDYYRKELAVWRGRESHSFNYEWNGITPRENCSWRYTREKMDEMYSQGRIIIKEGRVWIKKYRSEHPVKISSVWKYNDKTRLPTVIDSQSIERMLSMFVRRESKTFCPYERDGKFTFLVDKMGISWESIYIPRMEGKDLINDIPKEHYEIIEELQTIEHRDYRNDIVTNLSDIRELQKKVEKLSTEIKSIQSTIGLEDNSEFSVNSVIEKIHQKVTEALSAYSIEGCLPEAKAWIDPFWNRLEPETRYFIPTGILLYNQFNSKPDIDLSPSMIEFCKSLENELFKKMYFGYIKDLIDRGIDVKSTFPEAFTHQATSVFAEFLAECTTIEKENPEKWKFEMGKMAFVLQSALGRRPRLPIIIDFRNYLNRILD